MLSTTQRQDREPVGLKAWEIRQGNVRRALMRRFGVLGFCIAAGGFIVWPLSDPRPAPASAYISDKLFDQAPAADREGERIRLAAPTVAPAVPIQFEPPLEPQTEPPRRQAQATAAPREKPAKAAPPPPSATSDLDWYKTIPR
jgi:hypothetical protein